MLWLVSRKIRCVVPPKRFYTTKFQQVTYKGRLVSQKNPPCLSSTNSKSIFFTSSSENSLCLSPHEVWPLRNSRVTLKNTLSFPEKNSLCRSPYEVLHYDLLKSHFKRRLASRKILPWRPSNEVFHYKILDKSLEEIRVTFQDLARKPDHQIVLK